MSALRNFDRQITIEKKQVTQDPNYGTQIISWVPLVAQLGSPTVAQRFWAQVEDVLPSRSEAVKNGLDVARNQVRIRLRYRSDISSDMRIIVHYEQDLILQIIGGPARIGGRKDMLEIMCERYSS